MQSKMYGAPACSFQNRNQPPTPSLHAYLTALRKLQGCWGIKMMIRIPQIERRATVLGNLSFASQQAEAY